MDTVAHSNQQLESGPPVLDRWEREYQFSALSLGVVERWIRENHQRFGLELEARGRRRLDDRYLDTKGWRLFRAGYALRTRKTSDHCEMTIKSLAPASGDPLRIRREVSQVLPTPEAGSLLTAKGLVAEWLSSLAGQAEPGQLFRVETDRTTYGLKHDGQRVGEIALDHCAISQTGEAQPANVSFVELESDASCQDDLQGFVEAMARGCNLEPARLSKFSTGLYLNRLEPRGLPKFEPIELSPSLRIGELALGLVQQEFARFLQHEAGTRLGEDIEELHQMRVTCRRLRAALRLFGPYLSRAVVSCQDTLKWVGAALGPVRDLDVKLRQLGKWREESEAELLENFDLVLSEVGTARERARRRMLRVLDSRRYGLLISRLERALRRVPTKKAGAELAAAEVFPLLIGSLYRRVRKAGRRVEATSSVEDYHRLRIRCRRLRYALDYAALLERKALKPFCRRVLKLQDVLGDYNDAAVARANLRSWLERRARSLRPGAIFLLGRLEERYRIAGERSLAAYPKAFRKLKNLPWKGLEKMMNDA
jgi:CHAD domain-containing protein